MPTMGWSLTVGARVRVRVRARGAYMLIIILLLRIFSKVKIDACDGLFSIDTDSKNQLIYVCNVMARVQYSSSTASYIASSAGGDALKSAQLKYQ